MLQTKFESMTIGKLIHGLGHLVQPGDLFKNERVWTKVYTQKNRFGQKIIPI